MSGKAITVNKLDKYDYYDIGLIILFSLYAYFFMGQVFSAYSDSAVGSETFSNIPSFHYAFFIIIPLIFLSFIFYGFNKMKNVKISKQGFRLGKAVWISLSIIIVGTELVNKNETHFLIIFS